VRGKRLRSYAVAAIAAVLLDGAAHPATTTYPSRPIRIIVPFPPGGASDVMARVIEQKLTQRWGQQTIIDNRPGAGGSIAGEIAARAAPDGHTLFFAASAQLAVNPALYSKVPYDPVRDFAPITEVIFAPLMLAAHPSVPASTVKELIAEAKRAPGKLNFAVAGATGEIAGNLIKLQGNVDITNVPYKGGAPAMAAVMSNESQLVLTLYSSLKGPIDAGRLKPLGVTSARRDPAVPNVPTIAESGLPGYEVEFWVGVFAPAKTQSKVVHALNREIVRIINLPDVKKGFVNVGYEVVGDTPEHFAERVRRDTAKFRKTILDSKMQQLE
jgi:tripartite-type tricarboxylate transporter receptor subunit TctC